MHVSSFDFDVDMEDTIANFRSKNDQIGDEDFGTMKKLMLSMIDTIMLQGRQINTLTESRIQMENRIIANINGICEMGERVIELEK